tara:strand:+ start:549 stop:857 length:309 start_codon:yes stop_codon:yes gene_type:complete
MLERLTLGLHGDAVAEQANAIWHSWFERDILEPFKLVKSSLERESTKFAKMCEHIFLHENELLQFIAGNPNDVLGIAIRKEKTTYAVNKAEKQMPLTTNCWR